MSSIEIADRHASARSRIRRHRSRTFRWAWIFTMVAILGLGTCLSPFALLFTMPVERPDPSIATQPEESANAIATKWLIGLGLITLLPGTAIAMVLFLRLLLYRRVSRLIDTADKLGLQFIFTHEHPELVKRLTDLPDWPTQRGRTLGVGGVLIGERGETRLILAEPGQHGFAFDILPSFTPVYYVSAMSQVCLIVMELPQNQIGSMDLSTGEMIEQRWGYCRLTDDVGCEKLIHQSETSV